MINSSIYKIGQVCIELNLPDDMRLPENMLKFRVNCVNKEDREENNKLVMHRYFFAFTENIAEKTGGFLAKKIAGKEAVRDNIHVFQTAEGECRCLKFAGSPHLYAITLRQPNGTTSIWVAKTCAGMLIYDTVFVSLLSLEKLMMEKDALVLHSAYINYKDTAVLFSAPSETGKTTQANLWEKYRGTYTVNGDRSLLIREKDRWYAHGWPICGSSEVCHNERYPIRAIVMLKQAKQNKIKPLTGFRALREIMEQIMINTWDREYQIKVMDQLEKLLREVPVYCLECDMSEDAVECLESMIG